MATSMSSITPLYSELKDQQIRVLQIIPGGWHDEVECDLIPTLLHDTLVFDALSYAWGSSQRPRSIIVNGRPHGVTASVYEALRRLRANHGPTILWIDALCINQSDDNERTKQVQLMRDIYTKARQVIIYLGEVQNSDSEMSSKSTAFRIEADDDILASFTSRCSLRNVPGSSRMDEAFEAFCLIRSIAEAQSLEDAAPFGVGWRRAANSKYHRRLFEALRHLMCCRWWNRMWTLQEAVVPRDITIIYGPCVSTWDMFTRAAKAYSDHRPSETFSLFPSEYTKVLDFYSQIVLSIETMRKRWTSVEQTTLLPLLRQFSGRNATDPRDRVYALLGLVRGRLPVQPDYSIEVATLYQHTALGIISSSGTLSVLNGDIGRKLRQGLPSWVPDWTAEYHDLDRHRAETIHHYATTLQSSVYVDSVTFEDLRGIEDVLERMWTERHGTVKPVPQLWRIDDYTMALGTSDWTDYLPPQAEDPGENHAILLEAIEKYLMIQCGQVCLGEYGDGTISVPGVNLREIVTVGAVNMAGTDLIPTIQSWGILAAKKFGNATVWHAFMRTLCADIIYPSDRSVSGCRRVCPEDLKAIAHWFVHQSGSPFGEREVAKNHKLFPIRCGIEKDFPEDESSEDLYATLDVKHSIILATSRRAFFTTKEGGFGLGPAQISSGDRVYALLGAKTPFVLQLADAGNILQKVGVPSSESPEYPRFKVMGDCFLHGAMDGEAMKLWQEASSATTKTPISFQQDVQQMKEVMRHLKQYRTTQRQLEEALSALNGDEPLRQFTEFSWRFREKSKRTRDPGRVEDVELPLLRSPRMTAAREDLMIQPRDKCEMVKNEVENAIKSGGSRTVVLLVRGDPSDRLDEETILQDLYQQFVAQLERLEQLLGEAEMKVDAERVLLVRLMQELASNSPYVFLV